MWSEANGLMTPSNKTNRRALLAHYRAQLEVLYERAERRMRAETERKEREVSSLVAEVTGHSVNSTCVSVRVCGA